MILYIGHFVITTYQHGETNLTSINTAEEKRMRTLPFGYFIGSFVWLHTHKLNDFLDGLC